MIDEAVTASDLITLIESYRGKATFKVLINSCFSGRFVEELAPQPGVELVATASGADEVSYQALRGDTLADHPQESGTYVAGLTAEFRRILDGQEPNVDAGAVKLAKDDLVLALTLAADHSGFPGTGTDKAARRGLTHPATVAHASGSLPPEPMLTPIHAVFTPSTVPGCSPPACTTVYTENATGHGLVYHWSVSIPADTDTGCANGFHPNMPQPNEASWYHADETEGGPCNHAAYNAAGSGHPGTVTVVVSNTYWSCTATFQGTQGANGTLTGDGPAPEACQPKARRTVAGRAAPASQLYRFRLAGALHADWQWPVNPHNNNRRDTQAFDVLRGSGCGVSSTRAIWRIVERTSGLPAYSLLVDLVHMPQNPALLVDANYGGVPAADVKVFLRFVGGAHPAVSMTAKPHGDVAALKVDPSKARLTAAKVGHC